METEKKSRKKTVKLANRTYKTITVQVLTKVLVQNEFAVTVET